MRRFTFSPDAERDLDEILAYLDQLPHGPADKVVHAIQATLHSIAAQPYLGVAHSEFTRLVGEEVRSRPVFPYRIWYRLGKNAPEVFAILHGARDQHSLLRTRLP